MIRLGTGKCPKCDKAVTHAFVEQIELWEAFGQNKWLGVNYLCPHCKTVLATGPEPVSQATQTANIVLDKIKKAR